MSRGPDLSLVRKAQTWVIDGVNCTIGSITTEAKSRKVQIHHSTIYARLNQGMRTMDEILNPPVKKRAEASAKARQRERDEMAQLVAQMPRRRW